MKEMHRLYLPPRMLGGVIGSMKQSETLQCFCNSKWFYRRPSGVWHCEICDRPYDAKRDPGKPHLAKARSGYIGGVQG